MKKVLSKALAGILSVAMLGSLAYTPAATGSDDYQLRLDSIKAVNVQTAITGVKAYSDLIDTTAGYQVNDPIYLAMTVQVLNLEKSKYNNLKSIEDKDIPAVIGSANIDLSLSKYQNPILISEIYSGINQTPIGQISNTIPISSVVDYDKAKNEVKITFRGYQQNAVSWISGFSTNNLNQLYTQAAVQDSKIMVPALRAKNGKTTMVVGSTNYNYDWDAPEAMNYTIVLQGITKDNAGAAKGDFYAKIQVSGAEKFVKKYEYYVDNQGKAFKDLKVQFGEDAKPVEYVDYLKVPVQVLEIKDAYDVYRYETLSNGMIYAPLEIVYASDNTDYLNADKSGKVLAHVNPNIYDNTTDHKDFDKTDVDVAGGVNQLKDAVISYDYDTTTKTFKNVKYGKVPLSSVVYTTNYTVWAPAYYGVSAVKGDTTERTAYVSEINSATNNVTAEREVVDYWVFQNLVFDNVPDALNKSVTVIDRYTGKLVSGTNADGGSNGTGVPQYTTKWVPNSTDNKTGSLYVYPKSDSVYPKDATNDSTTMQSWYLHLGVPLKGYANGVGLSLTTFSPASTAGSYIFGQTYTGASPTGAASPSSQDLPEATIWQSGSFVDAIYIPSTTQPTMQQVPDGTLITDKYSAYATGLANFFQNAEFMGGAMTGSTVGQIFWSRIPSGLYSSANYVSGPKSSDETPEFKEVTKKVNLTYPTKGLQLSLKSGWNFVGGAEKATGTDVVPANIPGFNLVGVDAVWNSNQMWQKPDTAISDWGTTNGFANDATDLNSAKINEKGLLVTLTSQIGPADFKTASISGSYKSTDFENYTGAFVSDSTLDMRTAGVAFNSSTGTSKTISPPYNKEFALTAGSGAGASTQIPVKNVGWAQTQSMPATVYANSGSPSGTSAKNNSRGLLNARIRIRYNTSFNNQYVQRTNPMSDHLSIVNTGDNGIGHNGIATYVIQYNKTDQPIVAIATEMTYFDSTDGSSVAFFDAYNKDYLAKRILRSQSSNLTYSNGAGHVKDSEKIISAMQYFGLDTSFTTGSKVTKSTFETKGAPAVYSKELTNQFAYGSLTLYDEEVDEGTDETEVTPEPTEEATPEPTEDASTPEPTEEVPTEEVVTPDAVAPVSSAPTAPKTGDASASTAIALAATAIVAAAGLVFVMKKARR